MKALWYNKNKKVVIAETWNEITTNQFLRIVKLLHAGIVDEHLALDKSLHILSNKLMVFFFFIPVDTRQRMHEHCAWVFNQKDLSNQLLPKYRNFYGPADEFDNLCMKEFHAAEMAYYRLNEEKNINHLNELIAILYRPAKKNYDHKRNPDGDARIAYNPNETEWIIKKVKRWPLNMKRAILMWYDGCRQQLEDMYQPAFHNDGTTSSKNYYDGMYGMIRGIAEKKTYGDFDKVGNMNVHLAFKEIIETKLEEEDLKNKYPTLYK